MAIHFNPFQLIFIGGSFQHLMQNPIYQNYVGINHQLLIFKNVKANLKLPQDPLKYARLLIHIHNAPMSISLVVVFESDEVTHNHNVEYQKLHLSLQKSSQTHHLSLLIHHHPIYQ